MKRLYWFLLVWLVLVVTLGLLYWRNQQPSTGFTAPTTETVTPPIAEPEPEPTPVLEPAPKPQPKPAPSPVSTSLLDMKFYSQAPFGVWDALHEETCEEASVYMVKYWLDGARPSLEHYDQDLKNFVAWQTNNNYGVSVSVQQLKQATSDFIGMTLTLKTIGPISDLKTFLDAGDPVILPADGKRLNNPNFTDGGPIYHMLVVVGYSGDTFITKDPGTRNGDRFTYSAQNLSDSLGNWNGSSVDRSDRRVLVLEQ